MDELWSGRDGTVGCAVRWAPPAPARSLDLDPMDRMVLTADGTVTTLLEACTGEAIVTRVLRQAGPATVEDLRDASGRWWHPGSSELLELEPDERLLARRVALSGATRGVTYVMAEALVAPERLPEPIARRMLGAGASLGRVLAEGRLETRRDVLHVSVDRAGALGPHLGVAPAASLVHRTYAIVAGRRPVAIVTEWLPTGRLAAVTSRREDSVPGAAFVVDL